MANTTNGTSCTGYCQANIFLWSVALPPLLAIGLIGNLLIVAVFSTNKTLRKRKPVLCVTMVTLACADALVFLFPVTRHWLRHARLYVEFDVQTLGAWVCKVHEFTVYFSIMFSTWMIVLVSAERFTIICFPLRRTRLLSTRRVLAIIVVIATSCLLINAHILWTRVLVNNKKLNRSSCENINSGTGNVIVKEIFPHVDTAVTVLIPFLLLLLFNCIIAHQLYLRSQQLKTIASSVGNRARHRLLTPTTRMLLPVPLVFVPLALPFKVWLMINKGGMPQGVQVGSPTWHSLRFTLSCLQFLQAANFASNFFIYSLLSADFRADLGRLFCACRPRPTGGRQSVAALGGFGFAQPRRLADSRDEASTTFNEGFRVQGPG